MLFQAGNILCDLQTPTNGPALLADFQEHEAFRHLQSQSQIQSIENRNTIPISSTYVPSSPLHRTANQPNQPNQPSIFNFAFSPTNDQFQAQLMQQLQNLNNTYQNHKCNSLYSQQMSAMFPPAAPPTSTQNMGSSFRLSQPAASAYSSPMMNHCSNESPSKMELRMRNDNAHNVDDSHIIKPLSQGETITDGDGRIRVIVPVNDDEIPVPRLEPPPSGHKRSKEASPTRLGALRNECYLLFSPSPRISISRELESG